MVSTGDGRVADRTGDSSQAVVMETVEPREHPSDDREALLQAQYDKELGIDSKSLGCHGSGREFESEPADMNDMSSVCGDKSSESPELTVAERERQQQLKNIKFWIAECDAGRKALEDRITDNNTTTTPGGPWPHELSLVATYPTKSDTVLKSTDTATTGAGVTRCRPCSNYNVNGNATLLVVAWNDSKGRTGRVCDVKDNKVLALVPARHSLMDFSDCHCEIILNTIHLRPHKEGPKSRPELPPLAARLYRMYDAVIARQHAGPTESLTLDMCLWCNGRDIPLLTSARSDGVSAPSSTPSDPAAKQHWLFGHEGDDDDDEDESSDSVPEPTIICPLCLIPCHFTCAARVLAKLDQIAMPPLLHVRDEFPNVDPNLLPGRFAQQNHSGHSGDTDTQQFLLCAFCQHSVQRPR